MKTNKSFRKVRGVSDKTLVNAIVAQQQAIEELSARLTVMRNALLWALRELKHPNFLNLQDEVQLGAIDASSVVEAEVVIAPEAEVITDKAAIEEALRDTVPATSDEQEG